MALCSTRLLSPLVGGGMTAEAEAELVAQERQERRHRSGSSSWEDLSEGEEAQEQGVPAGYDGFAAALARGDTVESLERAMLERLARETTGAFKRLPRGMDFFTGAVVRPREHSRRPRPPALNPVARALLAGARDGGSAMHGALPEVLERIFRCTRALWAAELTPAGADGGQPSRPPAVLVGGARFPRPTGLDVNMMPFVLGRKDTLPESLHQYWGLIQECQQMLRCEAGRVVYLTVQESDMRPGQPQRRPGLHTEGFLSTLASDGVEGPAECTMMPVWHPWGMGVRLRAGQFDGGVFMASNMSQTTKLWPVELPRRPGGASHLGGGAEHLRGVLETGALALEPRADELVWQTDAVPHESLPPAPSQEGKPRAFFRLVTSGVRVWWAQHSTPNPLGVVPPPGVKVLYHSKFGTGDPQQDSTADPCGAPLAG